MMFFLLDSLPFNLILVHVSKGQGCPGLLAHPGIRWKAVRGASDSMYRFAGLAFNSQIHARSGHSEGALGLRVQPGLRTDFPRAAGQAGG